MNRSMTTSSTYQSEPSGPANPNATRFVTIFFVVVGIAIILLLGRAEISRWYHAKARNALLEHRYEDAVEATNTALEWRPDSDELLQLRAYSKIKNNDFEGSLEDYDLLIAKAAENEERNEQDIAPLGQKAAALQRLGRHTETLAIWDEIIEFRKKEFKLRDDFESQYAYAMSLNNRAYMVAQAYSVASDREQFDVEKALEQVRESIEIRDVPDDPVILDTLGYLLLLNEQPEEALKHLEDAVALTQKENSAQRRGIQRAMQSAADQRPYQDALVLLDQQYAIILHHRGEAYEAMDEQEKAKADLGEADKLGFDPKEGIW